MKKIILSLAVVFSLLIGLNSCTENSRTRNFGGRMTIDLPKGERLMEATWKEDDLYYLTEPMDSDYTPKVKIFRESSSWGILECTVTFVESR